MSGQYPGQFGPPPGGAPYGPGPGQGYAPGPVPGPPAPGGAAGPGGVAGPPPIPGRFGVVVRVLCALAPLVTFGLLGVVPSLLLAVRRRRAYDILGAAVFCALLLAMIVSAGVAGTLKNPTADTTGQITLAVLWLLPTAHFLVMDSRAVWLAGPPAPQAVPRTAPQVLSPYAVPNVSPYGATVPGYGAPAQAPVPAHAPAPVPGPVAPTATAAPAPSAPAPETAHDLRELGELLRRQAREDRP
ncbi:MULTISPECIES: hypothetical protein [unclassified Kitasatospora]|uniref:hypothetical protein n=1 Tax=unclassified Kitasatospora TaxID=2633591 RepID=UPI0033F80DB1